MREMQFEKIAKWQKETFAQSTALSKLEHMIMEVLELRTDILNNNTEKRLEFADCFILLFGAAAADGMSYNDICNCIDEKMSINYKRKWGQPDEKGIVNHIKSKEEQK
jgi:NTP pyrophosphatase (non-canonical NTP hydrolase)